MVLPAEKYVGLQTNFAIKHNMITINIEKISSLIKQLCEQIPTNDLRELVIFGSAAITLNRKDLKREIDDLDIFASESGYSRLKAQFSLNEKEKPEGVTYLQVGTPKIEIWKSFPGITFLQVKNNARKLEQSEGMLVASIKDLRIWKITQDRPKDKEDLKNME